MPMNGNSALLSAVIIDRQAVDEPGADAWPSRPEGRRVLDRLYALVEHYTDDRVLVTRDPLAAFGWNGLIAAPEGAASSLLAALDTGLKMIRHPGAIVLALDAPWVQEGVIALLHSSLQPRWDAVLPEVGGRLMPFPAIYTRGCLHRIALHLGRGVTELHALLPKLRYRPISEKKLRLADPELKSFAGLKADET